MTALAQYTADRKEERWPSPELVSARGWESMVASVQGVTKITPSQHDVFCSLLKKESDNDSYLTSPLYYLFTGRKGLWIYEEDGAFVPFCWHPNVKDQVLVFPQRGSEKVDAVSNLLAIMPEPLNGVRLARVKDSKGFINRDLSGQDICYAPVVEKVMDWKYPVHILSTKRLVEMDGVEFHRIRNHVRKAESRLIHATSVKDLSPKEVEQFLAKLSHRVFLNGEEAIENITLYQNLMAFVQDSSVNADGLAFFVDGKVEGITLWDVSNTRNRTANRFVNLSNFMACRGLTEYMMFKTAECLQEKGIQYLNIGGAETEGLDQFKRKFQPVVSIQMNSVQVVRDQFPRAFPPRGSVSALVM